MLVIYVFTLLIFVLYNSMFNILSDNKKYSYKRRFLQLILLWSVVPVILKKLWQLYVLDRQSVIDRQTMCFCL